MMRTWEVSSNQILDETRFADTSSSGTGERVNHKGNSNERSTIMFEHNMYIPVLP